MVSCPANVEKEIHVTIVGLEAHSQAGLSGAELICHRALRNPLPASDSRDNRLQDFSFGICKSLGRRSTYLAIFILVEKYQIWQT